MKSKKYNFETNHCGVVFIDQGLAGWQWFKIGARVASRHTKDPLYPSDTEASEGGVRIGFCKRDLD